MCMLPNTCHLIMCHHRMLMRLLKQFLRICSVMKSSCHRKWQFMLRCSKNYCVLLLRFILFVQVIVWDRPLLQLNYCSGYLRFTEINHNVGWIAEWREKIEWIISWIRLRSDYHSKIHPLLSILHQTKSWKMIWLKKLMRIFVRMVLRRKTLNMNLAHQLRYVLCDLLCDWSSCLFCINYDNIFAVFFFLKKVTFKSFYLWSDSALVLLNGITAAVAPSQPLCRVPLNLANMGVKKSPLLF